MRKLLGDATTQEAITGMQLPVESCAEQLLGSYLDILKRSSGGEGGGSGSAGGERAKGGEMAAGAGAVGGERGLVAAMSIDEVVGDVGEAMELDGLELQQQQQQRKEQEEEQQQPEQQPAVRYVGVAVMQEDDLKQQLQEVWGQLQAQRQEQQQAGAGVGDNPLEVRLEFVASTTSLS